ncbi:MAG: sigma-70 factor domain-containing protein [Calditrichota bacterium]
MARGSISRASQSLDKYLQEIGEVPLLTPQEEIDLARQIYGL